MPLNENEQRILEEIEKNLYKEDPDFARGVSGGKMAEIGNAKLGVALFLIGFASLIGFFVTGRVLIGVVAFLTMVGGIVLFAGAIKAGPRGDDSGDKPRGKGLGSALQRWEEKLRERYKRS